GVLVDEELGFDNFQSTIRRTLLDFSRQLSWEVVSAGQRGPIELAGDVADSIARGLNSLVASA
ncbi:MAG: hypothetical protein ACREQ3_24975, partial [Candidatus Binatia bacterium]